MQRPPRLALFSPVFLISLVVVAGCGRTELFGSKRHCAPTDTACQVMLPDGGVGPGLDGSTTTDVKPGTDVKPSADVKPSTDTNQDRPPDGTTNPDGPIACVARREICNNNADDNCNGLSDCKDPGCFGDPACTKPGVEVCNNGLDDDDDKLVDCADPDCKGSLSCIPSMGKEVCDNGVDDNLDKLVDCSDPQCTMFPACLNVACTSDVDFGTIAAHGANVFRMVETRMATRAFSTCAPPGGKGRVLRFALTETADVRMDLKQSGGAHVVGLFRAGASQTCDRNPVTCVNAADKPTATDTFAALPAGTYWLVVESYPNTPGDVGITLSTGTVTTPEQCANGRDDDGNGLVDCQDLACVMAPNCLKVECNPDAALGALVVGAPAKNVRVDLTKAPNRYHPSCSTNVPGGDAAISFSLPAASGIEISYTQTGRTIFSLFRQPDPGFSCDDGDQEKTCGFEDTRSAALAYPTQPAGKYILILKSEGFDQAGIINLRISAFGTRKVEVCSNNVDDDANGLVDCDDPACFGIGMCSAPSCMADEDVGTLNVGGTLSTMVDTREGQDLYQTACGKGNGKEKIIRFEVPVPMAVGIDCKDGGSNVLQMFQQLAALDKCDAHPASACADPLTLPFGCGFSIPGIQPGTYNLIVEGFQMGTEGPVSVQLTGIQEIIREICEDGIDNDNDGATDCMDRKCVTSAVCEKFACREDKQFGTLALDGTLFQYVVQTSASGDDSTQTACVSAGGGQDADVDFTLPARADLTLTWAQVGNHVFQVFSDDGVLFSCEAGKSFGCFPSKGVTTGTQVVPSLPAGRYHLVIDADHPGAEGGVAIQLSAKAAP